MCFTKCSYMACLFTLAASSALLRVQEVERLLFVFSKLNPGLEYVQGMNELVAPLYMVFRAGASDESDVEHAEADTFFCFVNLLTISEVRDLYCKSLDKSVTGVTAVLGECAPSVCAVLPDRSRCCAVMQSCAVCRHGQTVLLPVLHVASAPCWG
jgi:Rab-GTPase-TBC domain